MKWPLFVDVTTMVWLAMFVVGFLAFDADLVGLQPLVTIPTYIEPAWDVANWTIWGVFAVDVYYKYRRSDNVRVFLRRHWLDLVLLIPFFRVLLMLRMMRMLRLIRILRTLEVASELADMYFSGIRGAATRVYRWTAGRSKDQDA